MDATLTNWRVQRIQQLEDLLTKVCAERDEIEQARIDALRVIDELVALVGAGAGEDSPEYARALELIGAPHVDDVTAPSAPVCRECGAAMEFSTRANGFDFWVCAQHGVDEVPAGDVSLPFDETTESDHAPFTAEDAHHALTGE